MLPVGVAPLVGPAMSAMGLGSIAGGLGSLASGLSGLFAGDGEGASRRAMDKQFRIWNKSRGIEEQFIRDRMSWASRNFDDTAVQRRVADAQAAGVHPLFALGGSVSGAPVLGGGGGMTPSPGGVGGGANYGDALAGLGEGVSTIANAKTLRTMERLRLRQAKAEVALAEIGARQAYEDLMASRSAVAAQVGSASNDADTIGKVVVKPSGPVRREAATEIVARSDDSSKDPSKAPTFRDAVVGHWPDGSEILWPLLSGKPDVEASDFLIGGVKKLLDSAVQDVRTYRQWDKETTEKLRQVLRKLFAKRSRPARRRNRNSRYWTGGSLK